MSVAPYASAVFAEVSQRCFGGISLAEVGERAPLRVYDGAPAHVDPPALPEPAAATGGGLRLVAYKPLFSGPAVERVAELQFQRPQAEAEISADDARTRGIANGDELTLTAATRPSGCAPASTGGCAAASSASRRSTPAAARLGRHRARRAEVTA